MADRSAQGIGVWHQWASERAQSGCLDRMVADELYDHTWRISGTQIADILKLRPGETVVDAGSGWGRLIHALKSVIPDIKVRGYELTPEFVERSRELLRNTRLDRDVVVERADLTRDPLPKHSSDAFYSSRVLHYIADKHAALQNLYDCLKPGGRGVVIVPNRACPYRRFTYKHAPLCPIKTIGKIMAEVGFDDIRYGGFGFFPPRPRLSHKSVACRIDRVLSRTPLKRIAGLAYVRGSKRHD
jgi:SAM-dependent methyltransferase